MRDTRRISVYFPVRDISPGATYLEQHTTTTVKEQHHNHPGPAEKICIMIMYLSIFRSASGLIQNAACDVLMCDVDKRGRATCCARSVAVVVFIWFMMFAARAAAPNNFARRFFCFFLSVSV